MEAAMMDCEKTKNARVSAGNVLAVFVGVWCLDYWRA